MSRGYGKVMLAVLDTATHDWIDLDELTGRIFGRPGRSPTRAQVESVRRAVKRLEDDHEVATRIARSAYYFEEGELPRHRAAAGVYEISHARLQVRLTGWPDEKPEIATCPRCRP